MTLRPNKYLIPIKHKNKYLVTNLLNKSLLELPEETYYNFSKGLLNKLSTDDISLLEEYNFLIPSNLTNMRILEEWFKNLTSGKNFDILIFLNNTCNAKCNYCFQQNNHNTDTFTQIPESVIEFLKKKNIKKVSISIFGGEPLINIKEFKQKLTQIDFSIPITIEREYKITTNGYTLNVELIKWLKNFNIKNIQLTIDGISEVHNQRRSSKESNINEFNHLINQIKAIQQINDDIEIIIRTNIDNENISTYSDLLQYLSITIHSKNVSLAIVPTFNISSNSTILEPEELIPKVKGIMELILNSPFKLYPALEFGPCIFNTNTGISINTNGEISNCVQTNKCTAVKIENLMPRTINSDIFRYNLECFECNFFPICLGGCRKISNQKHSNFKIKNCQKELFNELLQYYYIDVAKKNEK